MALTSQLYSPTVANRVCRQLVWDTDKWLAIKAHANTMEPSVLFIRCLCCCCCCCLAALILICYEQWIVFCNDANILAGPFFFAFFGTFMLIWVCLCTWTSWNKEAIDLGGTNFRVLKVQVALVSLMVNQKVGGLRGFFAGDMVSLILLRTVLWSP
jgi:hypothetical protein